MASQFYGAVSLRIEGEPFEFDAEVTYDIGGESFETVMGAQKPAGLKVMPTAPYIEGTIRDRDDLDLAALKGLKDASITLLLRNGKTIWLNGAAQVGEMAVNAAEGGIAFRFEGQTGGES